MMIESTNIIPPTVYKEKEDWVVCRILEKRAKGHPDREFLQFECGDPVTYEETNICSNKLARGLKRLGVISQEEKVMIMLPNCLEYLYLSMAVNKLRSIWVPVHVAYKGYFLEHVANNCQARIMVVDQDYLDQVAFSEDKMKYLETIVVWAKDSLKTETWPQFKRLKSVPFDDLYDKEGDNFDVKPLYYDIATMAYTSGTTGPSKGVILPHAYLYSIAEITRYYMHLTEHDVSHAPLPLFHMASYMFTIYPSIILGGRAVIYGSFSASQWIEQVRRSRATYTCLVGGMAAYIYNQPVRSDDAKNDLRVVMSYPTPASIAEDFKRRFDIEAMLEGAGQTEAAAYTFMDYNDIRPGSCGKPTPWYEVRLVDPETDEEVPGGTLGMMVVRPKIAWCFSQGYLAMPDETVKSYRNLWFHTGDGFTRDDDGYYFFVDRLKDAIRRRGENISSLEIESILNTHPKINECAVVAVKSDKAGGEDEIKACVVLNEEGCLKPEDLLMWCEQRMPYFAVPRYVCFFKELPKTANLKIQKHKLKELGIEENTWDREREGFMLEEEKKKQNRKKGSSPSSDLTAEGGVGKP